MEISALIAAGGIVLVLATVLYSGQPLLAKDYKVARLAATRACLGACVTVCYYAAIQLCGLRDSTALFFTSPLWTLIIECFVRRKLPGPATSLGAIFTALGALFISKRCFCLIFEDTWLNSYGICTVSDASPPMAALRSDLGVMRSGSLGPSGFLLSEGSGSDDVNEQMLGMGIAVIAAVSNSLAFISIRSIAGRMAPMPLAFWYNVATLGSAIAFQALQVFPSAVDALPGLFGFQYPGMDAALMLAGVSGAQLLAQLCINRGFTLTTAAKGSTIAVLQVVFAFIFDYFLIDHTVRYSTVIGGVLIIIGVLVMTLSRAVAPAAPKNTRSKSPGGTDGSLDATSGSAGSGGSLQPHVVVVSEADYERRVPLLSSSGNNGTE